MTHKTLYLPNSARPRGAESEVSRENRQLVEEFYAITEKLEHFNRELREIDPHLSVVLAKPNTTVMGLKPNYYHLVRLVPGHLAYIKPIEGPAGEWRDLDSSIFDLAAEDDMWNDRAQKEQRAKAKRAAEAAARQRQREAQDRAGDFDERWKAHNSTSVLVSKTVR